MRISVVLEALKIKNFQCHERLVIRLDPRITTIVGPSDVGKSAVLRALSWLCFNKPSGQAFLRTGAKSVSVALKIDGKTICRNRSGGNLYTLDRQKFRAFGSEVPEQIAQVLSLRVENFQGQHDAPFWLASTAGQVGKELNAVIDLGLVDRSLAFVSKELRTIRIKKDVVEERLSNARRERVGLTFVHYLNEDLRDIERLYTRNSHNALKLRTLREHVQLIDTAIKTRYRARQGASRGSERVKTLANLRNGLLTTTKRVQMFNGLVVQARVAQVNLEKLKTQVSSLEKQLHEMTRGRCPVCGRSMTMGKGKEG